MDGTRGRLPRPGGHSLNPEDWKAFLDFADQHLGRLIKRESASDRSVHRAPGHLRRSTVSDRRCQATQIPRFSATKITGYSTRIR